MNAHSNFEFTMHPDQDYRTLTTHDLHRDIINYYDDCYWDYRFAWANGKNLALHYGYWDSNTSGHSESLLNMNRVVSEHAEISASDYILDAGCGLGGSSIWLAETYGAKVLGITLSDKQVERATQFAEKRGVAKLVNFKVADFCQTPFDNDTFDVVWGLESICYAVRKNDFVNEAYRVLRKGGRLAIADGVVNRNHFTASEWKLFVAWLNGWAVPNLATPDQLRSYLEQARFQTIDYRDISAQTFPSARRMYRTAMINYPLQKITRLLRLRNEVQDANFMAGLHQYHLYAQGVSGYGLISGVK